MKINDFRDLKGHITQKDMANIFTIQSDNKLDASNKKVYNIMRSVYFESLDKIPNIYFEHYNIVIDDTWPLIAHKLYKNTQLWWILIKLNDIKNPMVEPEVGKTIRYIEKDIVRNILNTIISN